MAKTPEHRRISIARFTPYEGRENRCIRDVLCWLLLGPDSTRTGLRHCRPNGMAAELGWSVSSIETALAQLQADGVILWSPEVRTVLCYDGLTCAAPSNHDHATSLRREVERFQKCACVTKALEIIDSGGYTVSDRVSDRVSDTREQRTENREQELKHAPLALVAVAAPAPKARQKPADESALLIASYNELCPSLAHCAGKAGSAAAKAAAAAWRREPDLALWHARFARAEASDFLTQRGSATFKADCLWLLNSANAEKLDAGRYDPRAGYRDPLASAIEQSRQISLRSDAEKRANPQPDSAYDIPF